jgi:hypothetical protein
MSLFCNFAINLHFKLYLLKKIIYLLLFAPIIAVSQSVDKKETRKERIAKTNEKVKKMQSESEEGAIIYNKQSAVNITLRSDGYAVGYERGKFKKVNKTNLWWIHLGERKHPKEEKVTAYYKNGAQVGNPYIYGKQNNFYLLNIGFGQQKLLGGKSTKNGIAISAIYGGGLSLGMLKPYYLEVKGNGSTPTDIIKYDESDTRFLDQ